MNDLSDNMEISVRAAERMRSENADTVFLDVREDAELAICSIAGALHVPMGEIGRAATSLPKAKPLVVLCHHGMRSLHVTRFLREHGFDQAVSMSGGIEAWACEVDASVLRY